MLCDAFFLLPSHLFPHTYLPKDVPIVMIEPRDLFSRYAFHKKRLIYLIESMRCHADELKKKKVQLVYVELNGDSFQKNLIALAKKHKWTSYASFAIEDRFLEEELSQSFKKHKLSHESIDSPLFLHQKQDFEQLLGGKKRPFFRPFYEKVRKELDVLMDGDQPEGGQFSYDQDNRLPLPKSIQIPSRPKVSASKHHKVVCQCVNKEFPKHPGDDQGCWLPTTRPGALKWLDAFCHDYFEKFGPYEDAISERDPFLFHSTLSPLLNNGLLTPREVLDCVLAQKKIPINSKEGFVRQLMGWREFIRGIDACYGEKQETSNYFKHKRKMKKSWYDGSTGLPLLDKTICKVLKYGYCHHIERLMILSNLMLLCELDPTEVYQWFIELFVDSADWVMVPNVYGMGQFADGGLFATKPYICGSNYVRKMSDTPKGPWCEIMDGLYWRFIDKHRRFFGSQPRLNMMVRTLDRMDLLKKSRLLEAAENFISKNTK